jgi:protein SCO1/2
MSNRTTVGRAAAIATAVLFAVLRATSAGAEPTAATTAPDFTLSDQNGHAFRLSQQRGRPVVLFFGYTHCPDVCPTILANLRRARAEIGPKASTAVVALITVDPERDTAAELGSYVSAFDPSFLGLRGDPRELAAVYRAYHVRFHRESEGPRDYLISHTAFVYYIGRNGRIRALGLWDDAQPFLKRSLEEITGSKP